jgi:hypothetical protein
MIRWQGLAALVLLSLVGPLASAASFSFTGTFSYDTDLQYFTFTLANPTAGVTLRTWSYAGGTNAAGDVIPAGGFEPLLNLYGPDGTQMNPGSSGPCTSPLTGDPLADLLRNPTTGACGDVYYPTTESFPGGVWDAGTYTVVLSTWANPGVGNLSDGFLAAVQGIPVPSNFTCQVGAPGVQGSPPAFGVDQPFCDELNPDFQNNGNWALDILGVDSASEAGATPEPGSLSLGLLGGVLLLVGRYRRRLKQG